MNLFNCFVLAVVSLGVALVGATYTSKVSATVGQSIALKFDYNGPVNARYYFVKNGKYFRADRRRVFTRLGKIYFAKVTEYDAGVYRMVVRDYRTQYNRAVTLTGEYNRSYVIIQPV